MRGAYGFTLAGASLLALPSGAVWWPDAAALAMSDLHFGRAERAARGGGALLPPFDAAETLARLDADLAATSARTVICVGDAFDHATSGLAEADGLWLARLAAGRRWIWIAGNHDPGPMDVPGEHLAELRLGPLTFRHIALAGAAGEVSGHYHPKARVAGQARRCFLLDATRLILPAYGTYAGGLRSDDAALAALMGAGALAILTGRACLPVPMPR